MFKKLKDKIEEEFKQAPLKLPVAVQQLAQVISPSPSVNSLSENNASSSLSYPTDMPNVSTDFFSIGGDDDSQDGVAKMQLTLQNIDLTAASPSNMTHGMSRSRRSSLSSVTSEASSLFPIYESGLNQNFLQSDLESEMEDGMSGQIDKVSKEQLYQTFKKVLNRYNKYKGRYSELLKHYKELQHENFKTKNVLQESQDKALRRVAELREQCQLEQKAKAHLEESLRNDVEERDHIIDTLKTKISLLSSGNENLQLIDFGNHQDGPETESSFTELNHLRSQNEDLQREIEKLKKIKETACHLIHRYDTTINEATEDVQSDKLKQKMSELKTEVQKMKTENESLSHLLSRNIITEEDKRIHASGDNCILTDLTNLETSQDSQTDKDEKDKKIEKLNNLLLKCKEKINSLNAEIKAKNLIIENNNKTINELKDEVESVKTKEQENALSVAENKKAIHEELDAKEKQIKALTKELKTKENEYIKEKEETIKSYEKKIRDITVDFNKELKRKTDQNQKLIEDLKAKEIVSGSLDKMKSMEDSFANIMEFVKGKSVAFEVLARNKAIEIETAQQKLDEKLTAAKKNLMEIAKTTRATRQPVGEPEIFKQEKVQDLQGAFKSPLMESAENFHVVEKLKSDVMNLSKKIEILENEVDDARKKIEVEKEEKEKWKKECAAVEKEREILQKEFEEKSSKNTELGKALTDSNEQIKRVQTEKEILQNASKEKMETESKLKEYMDKYNKLEEENLKLQNDLMEKCGKLLKDLNESKDRIKILEEEGNAKTQEIESLKKKHLREEKKMSKEIQELKKKWENLKEDKNDIQQKFTAEIEKIKLESEELKAAAAESSAIKMELHCRDEEVKKLKTNLEDWEEKMKSLEELDVLRKERIQEKEANERLKNELEALRGNLKGELKEKEDKSILVDKLTQECNLLLDEIENLKKTHSGTEKKLENELKELREKCAIQEDNAQKLKLNFENSQKKMSKKAQEITELTKEFQALKEENENLKKKQIEDLSLVTESTSDVAKIEQELKESEKVRQEMNEKMFKLTNEMNEAFGELQLKQSELDSLRTSFRSLQDELKTKEKTFEEEKVRLVSENENKLNVLKNEIKFINSKHEEDIGNFEENLNSEMKEANEKMEIAEKTSAELLDKLEKITSQRDELKALEEEKNMKITELENCMSALKTELDDMFNDRDKKEEANAQKHSEEIREIVMQYDKEMAERDEEIEILKLKLEGVEDAEEIKKKHGEEVRQIIMQYDTEIGQRDDEIELLKSKLSGNEVNLAQLQSVKEELKSVRKELAEKSEAVLKNVENDNFSNKPMEKFGLENNAEMDEKLGKLKLEFDQLMEIEKAKMLEMMRTEKEQAVAAERELWEKKLAELAETKQKLKNSAQNNNENSDGRPPGGVLEEIDLEPTFKAKAVNSLLETGTSTTDILEKQLIQQAEEMKELKKQYKKEIMELKKMSAKRKSWKSSADNQEWYYTAGGLENDTEHEYLKNILYEYMMGKEQLVLAKVLSAIVKFNEEQTHNVLEKEQQRQTLFGQLGLL